MDFALETLLPAFHTCGFILKQTFRRHGPESYLTYIYQTSIRKKEKRKLILKKFSAHWHWSPSLGLALRKFDGQRTLTRNLRVVRADKAFLIRYLIWYLIRLRSSILTANRELHARVARIKFGRKTLTARINYVGTSQAEWGHSCVYNRLKCFQCYHWHNQPECTSIISTQHNSQCISLGKPSSPRSHYSTFVPMLVPWRTLRWWIELPPAYQ